MNYLGLRLYAFIKFVYYLRVCELNHLLNVGWSIRIYILMTGRNVEQTKDVRMYIEEFILVDIWIHCCTKLN